MMMQIFRACKAVFKTMIKLMTNTFVFMRTQTSTHYEAKWMYEVQLVRGNG